MPNWVSHSITLKGKKSDIKKLTEFVKSEDRDFDFNKVLPIPKELEGTQSPAKIISQQEYDEQETRLAKGELTEEEKKWGISRGLTQELSNQYIQKFSANNWYDWQCSNWGTKWNASSPSIQDDMIFFETAWSTPYNLLAKLSELFPTIEIKVQFADEDFGHNVGEYTLFAGEEISSNIPEGGSKEAYLMALEISGSSEYYTWEMLFDIDEDEELSDFYTTMIEISYKEQGAVDEGFPTNVLNEFLSLAIADDNFELASQIRDILKAKEESGEEA
jgi:hypothetical protein